MLGSGYSILKQEVEEAVCSFHELVRKSDWQRKAFLTSMPNEILDRIFSCLFNIESTSDSRTPHLHRMHELPALLVCGRFLQVGLRSLLNTVEFRFISAEYDHVFYADCNSLPWPMTQTLPARIHLIARPRPFLSRFDQTGGVLSLESLIRSPCVFFPNTLFLITNLQIDIEIPTINMKSRSSINPTGVNVPWEARRVSHPHWFDDSRPEIFDWLPAELTAEKADYHMGVLRDLPFENLHSLKLGFGRSLHTTDRQNNVFMAIWIGEHLQLVDLKSRARRIAFPSELPMISRILEAEVYGGFEGEVDGVHIFKRREGEMRRIVVEDL